MGRKIRINYIEIFIIIIFKNVYILFLAPLYIIVFLNFMQTVDQTSIIKKST